MRRRACRERLAIYAGDRNGVRFRPGVPLRDADVCGTVSGIPGALAILGADQFHDPDLVLQSHEIANFGADRQEIMSAVWRCRSCRQLGQRVTRPLSFPGQLRSGRAGLWMRDGRHADIPATAAFLERQAMIIETHLNDGRPVCIRELRREDEQRLKEGIARLSPQSRYLRFFSGMREAPQERQ